MSATTQDRVSPAAREKAKDRIRKLMEMTAARGCTPGEADAAARMVVNLLKTYGLTMADVWGRPAPDAAAAAAKPKPNPAPKAKPEPPRDQPGKAGNGWQAYDDDDEGPPHNPNWDAWQAGHASRNGACPYPSGSVKEAWFNAGYRFAKANGWRGGFEHLYPADVSTAPPPRRSRVPGGAVMRQLGKFLALGATGFAVYCIAFVVYGLLTASPRVSRPITVTPAMVADALRQGKSIASYTPNPPPPLDFLTPYLVYLTPAYWAFGTRWYWLVAGILGIALVAGIMWWRRDDNWLDFFGSLVALSGAVICGGMCLAIFMSIRPGDAAILVVIVGVLAVAGGLLVVIEPRSPPVAPNPPPALWIAAHNAGLLTGRGVPLGAIDKDGKYTRVTYRGDRHIITIGPTGSGKNLTVQSAALMEHVETSAVIIDPKAQLCAITARRRREAGHIVRAINPFDVLGIPSATYNPLSHVNKRSSSFASDVQRIIEGIVDFVPGPNSHFSASALDFATMLAMWVVWVDGDTAYPPLRDGNPSPPDKSLIRVRQLMNMPASIRMKMCDVIAMCSNELIAEAATRYGTESGDSKEVRDSVETAKMQFRILRDAGIERVLRSGPNEITFADLKRRRETVYLILPPDKLISHGKFLRLLVLSALGEMFNERTRPPQPVLFMLEEYSQLGRMPLVEDAAAIIREYHVQLWIIVQNLPRLIGVSGKDQAEAFLSAAGVLQAFAPNDMTTARMLSERSGTFMGRRYSGGTTTGTTHTAQGATSSSGSSLNWQEFEQPSWKPGDILGLRPDQQLLFVPGIARPILAFRVPYTRRGDLTGMYDPDPYHSDAAYFEREARAGRWIIR